jgi:hypothetical protein
VYNPFEEIDPYVALPPCTPLTDQFTAVLVLPDTVAENCWVWPPCTLADVGDTLTDTAVGVPEISTVAEADLVVSATLCALTETEPPEGTLAGAVYSPPLEIVPTVELPPATPFTFQLTEVLVVPLTVAENCWLPFTCNAALVGFNETETDGAGCEEIPVPLSAIEAFAAAVPVTVIVPEVLP